MENSFPSPGVCGVTSTGEGVNCRYADRKGTWLVHSFAECREACLGCTGCRFLSYQPQDGDCSWFRRCRRLQHLGTQHVTHQVRHRNGSIVPAPSPFAPQDTAARKRHWDGVQGCKRLVDFSPSATKPALPLVADPDGGSRGGGSKYRIGIATLLATDPSRRPCRAEMGFGCALVPWCAGARRLQSILTSSAGLSVSTVHLIAIVGNHTASSSHGDSSSSSSGVDGSCRFERVDASADCPGLRIYHPQASLVAASAAHVERVVRSGVMSYNPRYMQTGQVRLHRSLTPQHIRVLRRFCLALSSLPRLCLLDSVSPTPPSSHRSHRLLPASLLACR